MTCFRLSLAHEELEGGDGWWSVTMWSIFDQVKLLENNLDVDNFVVLPVDPWTMKHIICLTLSCRCELRTNNDNQQQDLYLHMRSATVLSSFIFNVRQSLFGCAALFKIFFQTFVLVQNWRWRQQNRSNKVFLLQNFFLARTAILPVIETLISNYQV